MFGFFALHPEVWILKMVELAVLMAPLSKRKVNCKRNRMIEIDVYVIFGIF